ncbi:sigma-B regulation protein RsbQ [Cnuella takakiae]|uniref:Sigma-B regulation protein RsbQ n=1 Tax=Cnuella takakiae TaxID=1302690 RepID=A0A1M5GQ59_9BACT|nr:alpha/beta hydrolase [Cnuella takakiae]OLY90928.1 hypothetical protein BUE76_02705 [Cnuella takakiae]SHG05895.1 sigma-B regulation protein RsbQ [Cnuella takakiae]
MQPNIIHRNNVTITGKGKQPLIFAHGFGCDQKMWRFIVPAFEDRYQVILFDYVGSGCSDTTAYNAERYRSLRGYVQDVLDICSALNLRDAIFVGHSVSSMIGMYAAIAAPQYFSKLIMVGPSPCYLADGDYNGGFTRSDVDDLFVTMDKNYIGWANFLAPALMGTPQQPELGDELVQSFCSSDPIIARRFAEVTFLSDCRPDLHRSTVPTLVMQCRDDIVAPVSVGEYLSQHLPNSTYRLLNATGHCPHVSAPGETIEHIRSFLHTEAVMT